MSPCLIFFCNDEYQAIISKCLKSNSEKIHFNKISVNVDLARMKLFIINSNDSEKKKKRNVDFRLS